MIAQLSHNDPLGRPLSSIIGVRCAGSLARKSGVVVCPQTSASSTSMPAARTKMRTVRLLTLGLRMFSVMPAMASLLAVVYLPGSVRVLGRAVVGQRPPRSCGKDLDRIGQVHLLDVRVAAVHPQQVRLEQDVGVGQSGRRLETVGGKLDQQPQGVGEV